MVDLADDQPLFSEHLLTSQTENPPKLLKRLRQQKEDIEQQEDAPGSPSVYETPRTPPPIRLNPILLSDYESTPPKKKKRNSDIDELFNFYAFHPIKKEIELWGGNLDDVTTYEYDGALLSIPAFEQQCICGDSLVFKMEIDRSEWAIACLGCGQSKNNQKEVQWFTQLSSTLKEDISDSVALIGFLNDFGRPLAEDDDANIMEKHPLFDDAPYLLLQGLEGAAIILMRLWKDKVRFAGIFQVCQQGSWMRRTDEDLKVYAYSQLQDQFRMLQYYWKTKMFKLTKKNLHNPVLNTQERSEFKMLEKLFNQTVESRKEILTHLDDVLEIVKTTI